MAECPGCGGAIPSGRRLEVGDLIECPECGEALEVISLKPLEFDYAFDDEDWEEEDSEEEGD